MATIKVNDGRQGGSFRTGINGRMYDLPVGKEQEVDDLLVDHLRGLGVDFEEVEQSKGARSSKEGSEEGLAPIGPHDVRMAGTETKSLDDRPQAGDQPGDVTESGGVGFQSIGGQSIEDATRISDIRVAAERVTTKDDSVALRAGEGELGTEATEPPQGIKPTHVESDEEKRASKEQDQQEKAREKAERSKK